MRFHIQGDTVTNDSPKCRAHPDIEVAFPGAACWKCRIERTDNPKFFRRRFNWFDVLAIAIPAALLIGAAVWEAMR